MPHLVELQTLAEFDDWLSATPPRSLTRVAVQGLDLSDRDAALANTQVNQAVFLGCTLSPAADDDLRQRGALIFPAVPDLPFQPYRSTVYSADELYQGLGVDYTETPDARTYAWQQRPAAHALINTLAMSLHDHAIGDALAELTGDLAAENTIGIMGGHALSRGSSGYLAATRLAAELTADGITVLTGGGPGAMEAANVGAALAARGRPASSEVIERAVEQLAKVPSFRSAATSGSPEHQGGITAWARAAFEVRDQCGAHGVSIGVPTWFYGHEPPNAFATHIAKFFSNALREDTLLQRCRRGLIYLEGAAGTVQEIFQAATGNYYAADDTRPSPMVLVGVNHWTTTLPAWPLLSALARGRAMSDHIHLVDSIDEAVAVVKEQA